MDFKKASVAAVFALALVACLAVFTFHEPVENVKYDLFPGLSGDTSSEQTGSSDLDFNFGDDEGSKASDDDSSNLFSNVADEAEDDDTFGFPKADTGSSHLAADSEELHPDLSAYSEDNTEANVEDDSAESTTSPDSPSDDGTSYLDSLFNGKSADASTTDDASSTGGEALSDGDSVQVQYKLRLADTGKEVYKQWGDGEGGTFDFQLGGGHVIPGFDSAVSQMSVGQEKTVTIPASEAYGSKGFKAMGIPPDTDLEYTLKVVGAN